MPPIDKEGLKLKIDTATPAQLENVKAIFNIQDETGEQVVAALATPEKPSSKLPKSLSECEVSWYETPILEAEKAYFTYKNALDSGNKEDINDKKRALIDAIYNVCSVIYFGTMRQLKFHKWLTDSGVLTGSDATKACFPEIDRPAIGYPIPTPTRSRPYYAGENGHSH